MSPSELGLKPHLPNSLTTPAVPQESRGSAGGVGAPGETRRPSVGFLASHWKLLRLWTPLPRLGEPCRIRITPQPNATGKSTCRGSQVRGRQPAPCLGTREEAAAAVRRSPAPVLPARPQFNLGPDLAFHPERCVCVFYSVPVQGEAAHSLHTSLKVGHHQGHRGLRCTAWDLGWSGVVAGKGRGALPPPPELQPGA